MMQYGSNACASDFVIDEDNIWFVPFGYNYLCCYNLKQKKMGKKINLPVENNKPVLYGGITKIGGKILLIPFEADYTIAYDMIDGKIMRFPTDGNRHEEIYYAYSVENDNVWMIPWVRRTDDIKEVFINKINLYDERIEFLEAFPENVTPKDRGERWLFNGNCVYIENSIYCGYRNCIIEIDIKSDSRKTYVVGGNKTIYTTMCIVDDKRLCMMDIYGNVVIWDRKSGQYIEIENKDICLKMLGFPNGYGHREGYGSSILHKDECIWFMPSHADKVLQLDIKKNILSEAWFSKDICKNLMEIPDCCGQFSRAHISGEYLYVWNLWDANFFIIDTKNHKVERQYIESGINQNEFCSMLWKYLENNRICLESKLGVNALNCFIRFICADEDNGHS